MKAVFVYIFAVLLLSPSLFKMVVFVDYSMHKDFYANELCINQDKKELSCEGRCQLKNQINVSESEEGKKSDVQSFLKLELSSYFVGLQRANVVVFHETTELFKTLVSNTEKGYLFIEEQPPAV